MKRVILFGPHDLRLQEVDIPKIREDEALVKVKVSGICGSDVECYEGRSKEGIYPYTPGHEWSGEVIEVGEAAKSLKKGDRVVGACIEGCLTCDVCKAGINQAFCRNLKEYGFHPNAAGGDSEYVAYNERSLHKLPSNLTYEEGSLAETVSVAYHGVWGGAGGGVQSSDQVAIFGAGPIGLSALAIVKAAGACAFSVDPNKMRQALATKLGADAVIDPSEKDSTKEILRLTGGDGADLVVEASGTDDATMRLIDVAAYEGRIVLIGHTIGKKIPVELGKCIWKGLTIRGSCDSPGFFPVTLDFMARKKIDLASMITNRFPLEKVNDAFHLAVKRGESVKILLIP